MKNILWVVHVSPGMAVFIFWVSHLPTALCWGLCYRLISWGADTSIRGRGSVVTSFCGLKILCGQRNKPTKQIQLGTPSGFSPAMSVSAGRVWLGFLVTIVSAHRPRPWNKPSETPTSVMMMRFSSTTSRSTPCGRRLKRQRGAWRDHPMTAGSWWSSSRPWGMSWTGIIASSRMKATGGVRVGKSPWAQKHLLVPRFSMCKFQAVGNVSGKWVLVAQSCPTLCDPPWTIACQVPLSMGFSRQGYWSG